MLLLGHIIQNNNINYADDTHVYFVPYMISARALNK